MASSCSRVVAWLEAEAVRERSGDGRDRALPGARHREPGRRLDDRLGDGPQVGQRAGRLFEPLSGGGHEPAGEGPRRGERDLLAEHGADRELAAVDGAGHPQPRPGGDQRAEVAVAAQVGVGRRGVGSRQALGGGSRGSAVARVGHHRPFHADHPRPVW